MLDLVWMCHLRLKHFISNNYSPNLSFCLRDNFINLRWLFLKQFHSSFQSSIFDFWFNVIDEIHHLRLCHRWKRKGSEQYRKWNSANFFSFQMQNKWIIKNRCKEFSHRLKKKNFFSFWFIARFFRFIQTKVFQFFSVFLFMYFLLANCFFLFN